MENTNKRTLTLLSSFEISVLFFILGLVDGLEIRFIYGRFYARDVKVV